MTGKDIRRARKTLGGISQRALGEAVGLHSNTIARMERDELPIVKQTELSVKYLLLIKKLKGDER